MTISDLLIGVSGAETTHRNHFPASTRNPGSIAKKIAGGCLAAVILTGMAYPFVNDAYRRHAITVRLAAVIDERDRAAFAAWHGDAFSFARHLHARCELTFGKYAPGCDRYRLAAE